MQTILDKIVTHKRQEVERSMARVTLKELEKSPYYERQCYSLVEEIRKSSGTGIIAEFKRKSPSKGIINRTALLKETVQGYVKAGASGVSVLTDKEYFSGSGEDLMNARKSVANPILRKDFMLSEYQVFQSKSMGADVILLIAAMLDPKEIDDMARRAKNLGLEVLLEVHTKEELDRSLNQWIDIIGVNNRDLDSFDTHLHTSVELVEHIPGDFLKISESGISQPEVVIELMSYGFEGFLLGENFMKEEDPAMACGEFIERLKELKTIDLEK